MRRKSKFLLIFGIAGTFLGIVSGKAVFAKPDCAHPAMRIEDLGSHAEFTNNPTKYCYYLYHQYHAYCPTCGYEDVYHGESYYAVAHKWQINIEPASPFTLQPQKVYCTNVGCGLRYESVTPWIPSDREEVE